MFSNVAFGTASPYVDVDPAVYEINVHPAGGPLPIASFPIPQAFLGGEVITLVHYGRDGIPAYPQFLTHHPSDREWPIVP